MTRAEEAALKAYPILQHFNLDYDSYEDVNAADRLTYQEGYSQAEKDLALTWEDIRKIVILFSEVTAELFDKVDANEMCKEVLRRFNEYRETKK